MVAAADHNIRQQGAKLQRYIAARQLSTLDGKIRATAIAPKLL